MTNYHAACTKIVSDMKKRQLASLFSRLELLEQLSEDEMCSLAKQFQACRWLPQKIREESVKIINNRIYQVIN